MDQGTLLEKIMHFWITSYEPQMNPANFGIALKQPPLKGLVCSELFES